MPIASDQTATDLFPQLAAIGAALMVKTLRGLETGGLQPKPQNDADATLAPILTREDGALDLAQRTAKQVYDRWRGFYPWPGAHGIFRGKRLLVHKMRPASAATSAPPGLLDWSTGELVANAADGTAVVLDEVQLEGKPRMTGMNFARDYQLKRGEAID